MSLPTVVKTWQKNVNNLQAAQGSSLLDNTLAIWNIKQALLGFGTPLVMDYSCNSVTAGTKADGVDRITTAANIVRAAGAGAHSWFVLKMTGIHTNAEILFDFNLAAGNGSAALISVSTTVGFTGGSTTVSPTASDQVQINTVTNLFTSLSTDLAVRWSVWLSTDLQSFRVIMAAAGNVISAWLVDVPTNVVTGWSNPWFGFIQQNAPIISTLCSSSGATGIRSRIGSTNAVMLLLCEGSTSLLPADASIGQIANEISSEWFFAPIGVGSQTVGVRGRHGSVIDAWFGSNAIASGDSYPATGTTGQFAQFGNLILPWNNGAVNLS
jgi:hypothetical protein